MSYKVKYGDVLNYINSYRMCGEFYDLEGCVKRKPTKAGYAADLMAFRLDWYFYESKNLKYMPRKKKKKLARFYFLKYTRCSEFIDNMD